jgi:hypothetical protein
MKWNLAAVAPKDALYLNCPEMLIYYIYIYIYMKPSTQQISKLITTFVSMEFINYVKIMQHVSAHLEPSSGDTLFKAIKINTGYSVLIYTVGHCFKAQ